MVQDNKEKYINPYTDFGFKKLFGTEMNKDLLISFLNALFNGSKKEIDDVQYLNDENLVDVYSDRRSIFYVYCMAKDGSRFIVEMQKAEQVYFKDRSVNYATTPIRQQAPKGEWDYHLESMFDKWMFVLRNLSHLLERPAALQDRVFNKLFEQAEIASYSESERRQYEESKKMFWDNYSVIKTAVHKRVKQEKLTPYTDCMKWA